MWTEIINFVLNVRERERESLKHHSVADVRYTLIMTYMRSGSTITSQLLKTNDTFFFFEPFQGLLRDHRTNQHVCYPNGYCRYATRVHLYLNDALPILNNDTMKCHLGSAGDVTPTHMINFNFIRGKCRTEIRWNIPLFFHNQRYKFCIYHNTSSKKGSNYLTSYGHFLIFQHVSSWYFSTQ